MVRNPGRIYRAILASVLGAIATANLASACAPSETGRTNPQASLRGWRTNTEKRSIDLKELNQGGPPKDGIPALNKPRFVTPNEARRWLNPREPVVALLVGGEARAYPLQILIWHEIVNDLISSVSVSVTFCPLCYSAIVFDRRVDGREHLFGVSGMLRHSDMIMYDRESESLWQQLTGEAIVGDLTGASLKQLPAQIVSFEQFSLAHPDGLVMSRETGYKRDYGRNPYVGYDDISQKPFLYRGKQDRLRPMERVITVSIGGVVRAYPYSITRKLRVIGDNLGEQAIVIFHDAGAVSALDSSAISSSREVGSAGVFDARVDGQTFSFRYLNGMFADDQTGSLWNVIGEAIEGTLTGRRLVPIAHGDYFAFAWLAFRPETEIYQQK